MSETDQDKMLQDMVDDELLKRILPEAGNPDVVVLGGVFLGLGTEKNSLRLYTTMDLSQYIQVPRDKVLGVKRTPEGQVTIWVPRDLRVQMTTSQTMTAEFLRGSIQSAYMSQAQSTNSLISLARQALLRNQAQPITRDPFCTTQNPDPSNPICGLTQAGCPPPPSC